MKNLNIFLALLICAGSFSSDTFAGKNANELIEDNWYHFAEEESELIPIAKLNLEHNNHCADKENIDNQNSSEENETSQILAEIQEIEKTFQINKQRSHDEQMAEVILKALRLAYSLNDEDQIPFWKKEIDEIVIPDIKDKLETKVLNIELAHYEKIHREIEAKN